MLVTDPSLRRPPKVRRRRRLLLAVAVLHCVAGTPTPAAAAASASYATQVAWTRLDFYGALGLDRRAPAAHTPRAVRKAYRTLSLRYHPDKCVTLPREECEARMQELVAAHEVLKDTDGLRAQYDATIARLPAQWRPKYGEPLLFHISLPLVLALLFSICSAVVSLLQYLSYGPHLRRARKTLQYKQELKTSGLAAAAFEETRGLHVTWRRTCAWRLVTLAPCRDCKDAKVRAALARAEAEAAAAAAAEDEAASANQAAAERASKAQRRAEKRAQAEAAAAREARERLESRLDNLTEPEYRAVLGQVEGPGRAQGRSGYAAWVRQNGLEGAFGEALAAYDEARSAELQRRRDAEEAERAAEEAKVRALLAGGLYDEDNGGGGGGGGDDDDTAGRNPPTVWLGDDDDDDSIGKTKKQKNKKSKKKKKKKGGNEQDAAELNALKKRLQKERREAEAKKKAKRKAELDKRAAAK